MTEGKYTRYTVENSKINVLNVKEIKKDLHELIKLNCANLTINMENVNFIDSAGFGMLIDFFQTINKSNISLLLVNITPEVQELITLINQEEIFDQFISSSIIHA